jgi:branched-chain amino acid transport system substrate-binding protein
MALTKKLTALAAGLAIMAAGHAQEVKIAYNGDISASPSAESGQIAVMGITAAVDDINKRGGVLGRKLSFLIRDDLGQPPKSIQNMSDLIDREKVAAIFGPTNSGNALAWKHIANQKRMPVLVSSASSTAITQSAGSAPNYLFRISMVDRDQAAALVAYAARNPAIKKIGFFVETTGYGQAGLKDMEEIATMHGIQPVVTEKFDARDTDMTSQLGKAKAAGVDTLVVWAQAAPLGHLMRSMEKIDYKPRVLTTWAASFSGFPQVAGGMMEWPLFLTTSSEAKSPAAKALLERIGPKLANPSMFWAASQAYDTVLVWAAAAEQAKSFDGEAVRKALESLQKPVDGLVKQYQKPFTATQHEGLQAQDYQWSRWKDNKVVDYKDPVLDGLKPADFKK